MNDKIRIPVQKRSIDTKYKIIYAAEYLFSRKGFYKTNTKEIAKKAGVAIGTFYAYFSDKKKILIDSIESYNNAIYSGMHNFQKIIQPDTENPLSFIHDLINNIIEAHKILPEFHEEIMFLMHTDKDIKKIMQKYTDMSVKTAYEMLLRIKTKLRITDIITASEILVTVIEESVHYIFFNRITGIKKDNLINELADMINNYLFIN